MFLCGQTPLDSYIDEFFNFTPDGTRARLRRLNSIVTDETGHHTTTRSAATWLRHTHPVTGNSVPHVSPPFRGRRPCRLPYGSDYSNLVRSYAGASVLATPVNSSRQNCARLADHPHSWRGPDQPS